jgi:hypothetical protein
MFSATANEARSIQICLKLPNFVEIYPKIISFRIPPRIEILMFLEKEKEKLLYAEEAPKYVLTIWIFNITIFDMPFLSSKNCLCM